MGFYFRKSARFGPFRVNFSKSGIGISAGIPGFRLGTGPRGNYIQAGAHGFYYRAQLGGGHSQSTRRGALPARRISRSDPTLEPVTPDGTLGEYVAIESADVEGLADSSSEALLREIHQKHERMTVWPMTAVFVALIVGASLKLTNPWLSGFLAVAGAAAILLTYRWDVQRKLTLLHYELDEKSERAFGQLVEGATALGQCAGLWHLKGAAAVLDKKYHGGATQSVKRERTVVTTALPPFLASNVDPVVFRLSRIVLYLFPDRILVYQGPKVGALSYAALDCKLSQTQFLDASPPPDTEVIGHTWQYVNKSGGPDKRFRNNRRIPICRYGELSLHSNTGLSEVLQFSRANAAAALPAALAGLAAIPRQS